MHTVYFAIEAKKLNTMFQVNDTLISENLLDEFFVCDLLSCKGICCVEGDAGAPLEKDELKTIKDILPEIQEFLPENSKKIIREKGFYYIDQDGDCVTSLVNEKECVFAFFEEDGTCKCSLEKAYYQGKTDFCKPISCHLYPVRLQKINDYTAVNLHHWKVCECAFVLGKKLKIPAYRFLKVPLIRRFGEKWYKELELIADLLKETRERND